LTLDLPARDTVSSTSIRDFGEYVSIEKWEKIDYKTVHLKFDLYKKEGKDLKYVKSLEMDLKIYPPKELKEMLEEVGFKILFVFKGRSISDIKNKLDEFREGRVVWVCYK